MKVTILFERLGPYHHARLNALGDLCDLTAIEHMKMDGTYKWDLVESECSFKQITLFPEMSRKSMSLSTLKSLLWPALSTSDPDVVAIPGWGSKLALLSLAWCTNNSVPCIVMSDSQEIDERRVFLKELFKKCLVRLYDSGFVGGSRHVDYLIKLGMSKRSIFLGYDVVDNSHFSRVKKICNQYEKYERPLGKPYFLTCSRLIAEKNITGLISAYYSYVEGSTKNIWDLVVVGDGPLRDKVEAQVSKLNLRDRVDLVGFKQYDELPYYYCGASVYVQASIRDTWCLSVNEALASGLPVLVSERCGCSPDLVLEGVNGYSFDPKKPAVLSQHLMKAANGHYDLNSMSNEAVSSIAKWTPYLFATNLLKAAAHAKEGGSTSNTKIIEKILLKLLCLK